MPNDAPANQACVTPWGVTNKPSPHSQGLVIHEVRDAKSILYIIQAEKGTRVMKPGKKSLWEGPEVALHAEVSCMTWRSPGAQAARFLRAVCTEEAGHSARKNRH